MIELETVKSAVDLFKELVGFINNKRKGRHKILEHTCKLLHERLEPIVNEYYLIINEAEVRVAQQQPALAEIFDDVAQRRSLFIMARNGILGEAQALKEHHSAILLSEKSNSSPRTTTPKGLFETLVYEYAISIETYFGRGKVMADMTESVLSKIVDEAIYVPKPKTEADRISQRQANLASLRHTLKRTLKELEERWLETSRCYTALKLYCELY